MRGLKRGLWSAFLGSFLAFLGECSCKKQVFRLGTWRGFLVFLLLDAFFWGCFWKPVLLSRAPARTPKFASPNGRRLAVDERTAPQCKQWAFEDESYWQVLMKTTSVHTHTHIQSINLQSWKKHRRGTTEQH